MDVLTGTIERITFYNPETNYGVIKVLPDKLMPQRVSREGLATVVGTMPELGVGEAAEFSGEWVEDPRWGMQLRVTTVNPITPTSIDGITRYLSSGIVAGIGPKTAEKIVKHFGEQTIDILNRDPQRLNEVPGLKSQLVEKLADAWRDNYAIRNTMIFLQQYGVTSRMATKIYNYYGAGAVSVVKEDPYQLADEVYGIGFIKADQIARSMGLAADDPKRLRAGLTFTLDRMAQDGNVFAPRKALIQKACELLQVSDRTQLAVILDGQVAAGKLVSERIYMNGPEIEAIYLPDYHEHEVEAAEQMRYMARIGSPIMTEAKTIKWEAFLKELSDENKVELTKQQQGAVRAAFTSKVSVLTGGPGTGKTTTLRMVISALDEYEFKYALASPTGRAAKRLSEATERDAFTIHRLLGYSPAEGGFAYDEEHPLDVHMLIVDEASMIDLMLFHAVLMALPPHAHLMLVGDVDQLPSVGAGNVLHDVINSGLTYVTRLETIFRQSEDSHIILNAHRINQGHVPFMQNQSTDFFFFRQDDPEEAAALVVDIVKNRLPEKFSIDPKKDVQVIAPMYRGSAGINVLNEALQKALNPNNEQRLAEQTLSGRTYRVGDKVMQTRNNYDKEVFNGDIGVIYAIDLIDSQIEVQFDGNRFVPYDYVEADELIHAYCISTHRSQGSEYPVVVLPLLTQHYMMLQRNLLYTAITRAKKVVVLVGNPQAVHMAVKNNKVAERYTGLRARLQAT
ncbi:MAG: ATP-dependent RecD-like DNA helicase [Anaerolineae bacterium]